MESDDGYITLDDDEPAKKHLISYEEYEEKMKMEIKKALKYEPSIKMYEPETFSLNIKGEGLIEAIVDKDESYKGLRVYINNKFNTTYIFNKKPKFIQRIFLKILGIKWTLEI